MSFLLPLLLLVVFAACVGFLYREGMWANGIRLINVVTAALLATNFWEPLARLLEDMLGASFTYLYDFLSLWLLFAVIYLAFHLVTNKVSRVKVRFLAIVNKIGGGVLAAAVGWVLVSFTLMTLHTAPLGEKFFFGGFDPNANMLFGLAPDHQWLAFMGHVSRGAFSKGAAEGEPAGFDPEHKFIDTYRLRRLSLQAQLQSAGSIKPSGGIVPRR
jgi:hypothetical protein